MHLATGLGNASRWMTVFQVSMQQKETCTYSLQPRKPGIIGQHAPYKSYTTNAKCQCASIFRIGKPGVLATFSASRCLNAA